MVRCFPGLKSGQPPWSLWERVLWNWNNCDPYKNDERRPLYCTPYSSPGRSRTGWGMQSYFSGHWSDPHVCWGKWLYCTHPRYLWKGWHRKRNRLQWFCNLWVKETPETFPVPHTRKGLLEHWRLDVAALLTVPGWVSLCVGYRTASDDGTGTA